MKSHSFASLLALLIGTTMVVGCGSSQSKPESVDTAAEESPETESDEAADSEQTDDEEGEPAAASESEPEETGPTLSRSVEDIIAEPDNAWVVNFPSSEPYEKAGEQCDARFKDNPQERASCMNKARSSFVADAMEFKKAPSGGYQWVVYKAQGSRLIQIYSVPVSFGEEKAGTLQINKTGNGKGTPPLFGSNRSFSVKLLSNYRMELDDGRHGRLVYDARIGFISK